MQVLPARDFKNTEALINVQLEKEGHDKTKLEAETWVQPSPLQEETGMLEDLCSFGNIS